MMKISTDIPNCHLGRFACFFLFSLAFFLSNVLKAKDLASPSDQSIDLSPYWDESRPLENPHKGWYHHYYDNRITSYLAVSDEEITSIKGMDHLYLRLAWSYLEPAEGEFNWGVIDKVINHWVAKGVGISFRITCKETGGVQEQIYATPHWVMESGAKGERFDNGKTSINSGGWEPEFDDPVFLRKLDQFLGAFALRYDGKPWVRYVDVGSVGDWGEGHTGRGSHKKVSLQTRKQHINIYLKHFKKSRLVVTDDFVYELKDENEIAQLHQYVLKNNITYRDDSILTESLKWTPKTFSVSRPDFFKAAFRDRPTILETCHFRFIWRNKYWVGEQGSGIVAKAGMEGPEFLKGAVKTLRCSYIGYHGLARHWWKAPGNPKTSNELLNLCGYWYFPKRIALPYSVQPGAILKLNVDWVNKGVAPAYHPYHLDFILFGPDMHRHTVPANNKRWFPEMDGHDAWSEGYEIRIPGDLPFGKYKLSMKMYSKDVNRRVELGVRNEKLDKYGFLPLGNIEIGRNL